jgi:hypothetical protein
MTPQMILARAATEGVCLSLSPHGVIKASGEAAIVHRWVPMLRAHKPALVALLADAVPAYHRVTLSLMQAVSRSFDQRECVYAGLVPPLAHEDMEWFDERAAIGEYVGGLSREAAEAQAFADWQAWRTPRVLH